MSGGVGSIVKKDEKASLSKPALALSLVTSFPSSGDFRGGVGFLLR